MAGKEGEKSYGQLIRQNNNDRQELAVNRQSRQEGSPPALLMDPEVARRSSYTPKGEDPAFWPVRVFTELEYYTSIKDKPTASPTARNLGQKYAPFEESIRKVKTAYSILAYPHIKHEGWKENIGANLELERQGLGQDQVELNDQELKILSQLTAARNLPFNHKKRVYSYSDVPIPPWVDPYGRRHLTTGEIRKKLNQNKNEESR